ncbi:CRISPR-associated endoribonuclease Cas6 [uncultured archaeon]|nr:CRISPR-associated endoribonuclease Cas6 [uncultured archaeon]
MKISKYRFIIKPQKEIILPTYKGFTFRGGFGHVLKHSLCHHGDENCTICDLRYKCAYYYVFETGTPRENGKTESQNDEFLPHPFFIEPMLDEKEYFGTNDRLYFDFILIGRAVDYIPIPYFISAFGELGRRGIGKKLLFSWDEILRNKKRRLIEFLIQKFGIDWIKTAKIEKTNDEKTIKISTEKNCLSLKLNNEKTEVNLKIDDGRTDDLISKMEKNKLNIYGKNIGKYSIEKVLSLNEDREVLIYDSSSHCKDDNRFMDSNLIMQDEVDCHQITLRFQTRLRIKYKRYLFNWGQIPGNDSVKLIEFLKQKYCIDWVKIAKIEKIENSNIIIVYTDKNGLWLRLNDKKNRVNVQIDNVRTDELIAQAENGELNIYYKSKLARVAKEINFEILVRNLLRRLSWISEVHCGEKWELDWKGLIERAKKVKIVSSDLKWKELERYSERQETRMKMGGLLGEITFEGELAEFMPFIKLGEYLHIGKGTVFGLGKYQIIPK